MTFTNRFSFVPSRRSRTMCAALSLGVATACSGSGSAPTAPIAPSLTSLPTATNTLCVTPSTSAQTVALPSTGGVSGSIEFGGFSAAASGCDGVTISTGSDVESAQSSQRRASQAKIDSAAAAVAPLLTISVGAGAQQNFTEQTIVTGIQLNVASSVNLPDGTYYATITPSPVTGPGVFTFTAKSGALRTSSVFEAIVFNASVITTIAVYPLAVNPTSTATPSASPTASGNPTPTPMPSASGTGSPTPRPSVSPTPLPSASATPTPSVTPTLSPTPKPSATPTPSATPAVYPLVAGESFTYSYYLTKSTTAGGTTVLNKSFNGTLNAQLSGLGSYNGNPAYTLHTQGSTTSGQSASLNNLDYINLISTGGHTEYVEYGYNYQSTYPYGTTGSGAVEHDSTILSYATPFINDILPETPGAAWAEPVAISETVNDYYTTALNNPNIISGTLTRNSDGSYNASGMNYNVPETRLLRSDGTGYFVDGPASGATQWSFGLPQAGASGEVIPATESYAGQSATNLVPDWYPGGGQPSSPLATETSTDLGQGPAPSTCGTKAGTSATHIKTTFTQLDTIEGLTESDVTDLYVVPGVGYICRLETDTVNNYHNEVLGTLANTQVTKTTQVLTSYVP